MQGNLDSQIRETFAWGIRNSGNVACGIQNPWLLESDVQFKESGIPLTIGIFNPSFTDKNPDNPWGEFQNPGLSWIIWWLDYSFLGEIGLFNTEQLNFGTTPNDREPWGYFTAVVELLQELLYSASTSSNIIEFRLDMHDWLLMSWGALIFGFIKELITFLLLPMFVWYWPRTRLKHDTFVFTD